MNALFQFRVALCLLNLLLMLFCSEEREPSTDGFKACGTIRRPLLLGAASNISVSALWIALDVKKPFVFLFSPQELAESREELVGRVQGLKEVNSSLL